MGIANYEYLTTANYSEININARDFITMKNDEDPNKMLRTGLSILGFILSFTFIFVIGGAAAKSMKQNSNNIFFLLVFFGIFVALLKLAIDIAFCSTEEFNYYFKTYQWVFGSIGVILFVIFLYYSCCCVSELIEGK